MKNFILLPSNDKAVVGDIIMRNVIGSDTPVGNIARCIFPDAEPDENWTTHHLYEISNDTINVGDFYVNLKKQTVFKCYFNKVVNPLTRKIIRTNNPNVSLPRISNSTIDKFIKYFNDKQKVTITINDKVYEVTKATIYRGDLYIPKDIFAFKLQEKNLPYECKFDPVSSELYLKVVPLEIKHKTYKIEMSIKDDKADIVRTNTGFNAFELLGILEHARTEIMEQIQEK